MNHLKATAACLVIANKSKCISCRRVKELRYRLNVRHSRPKVASGQLRQQSEPIEIEIVIAQKNIQTADLDFLQIFPTASERVWAFTTASWLYSIADF